jgi:hypothetical protein
LLPRRDRLYAFTGAGRWSIGGIADVPIADAIAENARRTGQIKAL